MKIFAGVQFPSDAEAAVERQEAAVPAQARRPRGAGRWVRGQSLHILHLAKNPPAPCCLMCRLSEHEIHSSSPPVSGLPWSMDQPGNVSV